MSSLTSFVHISAHPSVKGGEFRQYRGSRAENDIVSFVDDGKWKELDPVPWYTAPTAMQ